MSKKLILIGAGGHGGVLADIAKKNGYSDIRFLDDNPAVLECGGYPVVGSCLDRTAYSDFDFAVSIGSAAARQRVQTALVCEGFHVVSLIHPAAVIAENATLGVGTVVMAGAVINPGAKIGEGCIINTCSSVDHDCVLGSYVHVSAGAHIAGTVSVGERTWIGIGATIINNVDISEDCLIGAGAVVVKSIENPGVYVGVPATKIR